MLNRSHVACHIDSWIVKKVDENRSLQLLINVSQNVDNEVKAIYVWVLCKCIGNHQN